ncbi:hypothetical protein EAG_04902 [Camponotus floridanus]|uniref:Uncharacterized protein n=1 Tax=Camponotus floridanus TaxID=104421 RepID=E2AT12_CAMFO|nr:hypothetical protein EAG_04902 [Camponotus floridanus]
MMAECARTEDTVLSGSIEHMVESVAYRGGNIERKRGSSTWLVITQPLDSLHPADTASSIHLSSQTSDRPFIASRLFRRTIRKCASSLNEISYLSVPTPDRDEENEEITARRERAKRVPISKRSKLKDQSSPNFIDPWPEAWRRIDERSLQPRKLESASPIDDGFRPAVRAFTPLLEPVFKFGESILRPENSLRDILLHESASKTTATTTTAVATTTTTRNIAYLGATRRTGSIEKDDIGGVTEDGIKDDKKSERRELVLVGNKNNGAVVVGSDSVIEWTTTTVTGPMSSSRSAFSGDDVQVAEHVRVRANSERNSPKNEESDEEQNVCRPTEFAIRWSYLRTTMGRKSRRSDVKPPVLLAPSTTARSEGVSASGYIVSAALVLIIGALVGVLATISRHLHHRRLLVHEPVPPGSASSSSASILHYHHRHHHHRHRLRREEPPPPPLQRCLLLQDHCRHPDTPRCRIPGHRSVAKPFLGKTRRTLSVGPPRALPSVSIGIGRRELNLEVTGPVITSRRVGGKFRLSFSALRDVAMHVSSLPSPLPPPPP